MEMNRFKTEVPEPGAQIARAFARHWPRKASRRGDPADGYTMTPSGGGASHEHGDEPWGRKLRKQHNSVTTRPCPMTNVLSP
jgi:hypothetical protein